MSIVELLIIAIGLSMDAFAVAICNGLCMKKVSFKKALTIGLYFGGFQAAMPAIGYLLGVQFVDQIEAIDHWVAFILLGIIGAKMIKDSFQKDDETCPTEEAPLNAKKMIPLAFATSIDALIIGVSFAFLQVDIVMAVSFIGIITLVLSMIGVQIGHVFGLRFKSKAELVGGLVLVGMGLKIFLEHNNLFPI